MTDLRVAAFAAALHDEWDRRQGEPSEPGVLCPACVDSAAAILAVLRPDWCGHEVPGSPDGADKPYCTKAETLRAALGEEGR